MKFLVAPAGRLHGVEGLQDAFAAEGILGIRIYRRPGHVFGPLRRGSDRAGALLAVGNSAAEALERAEAAADLIRFDTVDVDAEALA